MADPVHSDSSEDESVPIYGIEPNLFEPEYNTDEERINYSSDSNDSSETDSDNEESRIGKTDWCQCTHCQAMTTQTESVCCKEIPAMMAKSKGIIYFFLS